MQNDTCYILALIKRDDGERLLLGSGFYEFTKEQKHFNPNLFANDVVELQGADGQLLAGQVRRSTAQSFDGYIGDGTTSKQTVEQKRREFFLFFRKQHHYTVVYIMPDGTAIKRDRGYIVDAPAVQELHQVQPKWHVSLAFEDVNYYSYAEDSQGQEIYAFSADLNLASVMGGGLKWDANGAISTPAGLGNIRIDGDTFQKTYMGKNMLGPYAGYGTDRGITTAPLANGKINLNGKTTTTWFVITPNSEPLGAPISAGAYTFSTDNAPAGFKLNVRLYTTGSAGYDELSIESGATSVTGTVTATRDRYYIYGGGTVAGVEISGDFALQLEAGTVATSFEPYTNGPSPNPDFPQPIQTVTGEQTITIGGTDYTLDLGATELCKLGTYQDYIWKDGDDWKVHKATTSITLSGSVYWGSDTLGRYYTNSITNYSRSNNVPVSSHFGGVSNVATMGDTPDGKIAFNNGLADRLYIGKFDKFTSASVLTQWLTANAPSIYYALATPTDTTITDATLIAQLNAIEEAMGVDGKPTAIVPTGNNLAAIITGEPNGTGGYEWEASEGGGPSFITVEGVDDALPVWHVVGPATNPTLTNSSNGLSITWNGTVPAGQELIVDMGAQTATMEGANVFQYISGSWLTLSPGTNRIAYTATNTTAGSKIYWNEIVG